MELSKWDARFIDLARHVARWSKDPRTQVGSVLVGMDPRQVALGYNGFPPGVNDTPERLNDRTVKHAFTQHAERNVLDNAFFDTFGATIYVTMFPCADCAKSIISKGIRRLVTPAPPTDPVWAQSAAWAMEMLTEAGILVDTFDVVEG